MFLFIQELGAIANPEDHLTTAIHLGEPSLQSSHSTPIPPHSSPPPQPQPTSNVTMTTTPNDTPVTFWHEIKDTKTSYHYYWNAETNETTWTLPENAVITSAAAERSDQITDPENEELELENELETNEALTNAYAYYAKTLYGVETGEKKETEENGVVSTDIPSNNEKIKKQEDVHVSEEQVSGDVQSESKKQGVNKKTKKQVCMCTCIIFYVES